MGIALRYPITLGPEILLHKTTAIAVAIRDTAPRGKKRIGVEQFNALGCNITSARGEAFCQLCNEIDAGCFGYTQRFPQPRKKCASQVSHTSPSTIPRQTCCRASCVNFVPRQDLEEARRHGMRHLLDKDDSSSWVSTMVTVPKPDVEIRLCLVSRNISNVIPVRCHSPLSISRS